MRADGMSKKLLRLIKGFYQSTRTRICAFGEEAEMFEVKTGVRQGYALSPTLFNYTIDYNLDRTLEDYVEVEIGRNIRVSDLAYEDVQSFVYLGSTIRPSGQGAAEVDRRIGAARSTFVRLKRSEWGRREISTATKGRTYQAIVRTILLYGCETWPLRAVDLRKLDVFDNDCLRYILRCRRIYVPTTILRDRLNLRSLPPVLLQSRLRWFGHASRRPEGELIRHVLLLPSLPNCRKRAAG